MREKPSSRERYLEDMFKIIKENEKFLYQNAKQIYDEVIELVNDSIDFLGFIVKNRQIKARHTNWAICFFSQHVLMPFSCAIYVNFLIGNLPVCFTQLRLLTESLAKCFYADLKFCSHLFFMTKLELLELEMERQNISISQLMREIDRILKIRTQFLDLWKGLSYWVHAKGIVERTVSSIVEGKNVPSWALVLPINYSQDDINEIQELGKEITQFREILKNALDSWKQLIKSNLSL